MIWLVDFRREEYPVKQDDTAWDREGKMIVGGSDKANVFTMEESSWGLRELRNRKTLNKKDIEPEIIEQKEDLNWATIERETLEQEIIEQRRLERGNL